MIYILQNLPSILPASVLGILVALTSRRLFHAPTQKGMSLLIAWLCQFWLASILAGALILAPNKADPWTMSIGTALILWVGFVAPAMLAQNRLDGRPLQAVLEPAVTWLLVLVVQALLMQSLGLVPPE